MKNCKKCGEPGTRQNKVMGDDFHVACRPSDDEKEDSLGPAEPPAPERVFAKRLRYYATALDKGDLDIEDVKILLKKQLGYVESSED